MRVLALLAVLALAGACSTTPEREGPTPQDCVDAKGEVDVLVAEAVLNARWSRVDLDKIRAQGERLRRHVDQFAEAAGIATTVAVQGS